MDLMPDGCGYDTASCEKWKRLYPIAAGIELTETYPELMARVKNGKRDARKAERLGYTVERFHYPSWHDDLDAIHHSMPVRSGGVMQGHYGDHLPPNQPMQEPNEPTCPNHWRHDFGAFLEGRLVAYIGLVRVGDTATYMQLMTHGDHLASGVMYLTHFETMRWCLSQPADLNGCRCVWYTDMRSAPGLVTWKRKAGFREVAL